MEYPFKEEPPAHLLARAESERLEYPSREIRPFVRELADRGCVSPEEWAVPMNSYERDLLMPVLGTELLAGHLEYSAANCMPALSRPGRVVTYDEAVALILAPAAARRLRLLEADRERLLKELDQKGEVTFGVQVCDDHDGGSVWLIEEEWYETRGEADELAAKFSRVRDNEAARVVEVTRRVVAEFRGGEQIELAEGQSRHVDFSFPELTGHHDLPRPTAADLERWKRLAEKQERAPARVLAILVKEVERLRAAYEKPFNWRGLGAPREPTAEQLALRGPEMEKVEDG